MNLIAFLAVILLFELQIPESESLSAGGRLDPLLWTSGFVALYYVAARIAFGLWERKIRTVDMDPVIVPFFHGSMVQRMTVASAASYALVLYVFQWKGFCLTLMSDQSPSSVFSFLGILPFILMLLAVWVASYRSAVSGPGPFIGPLQYLFSQVKMNLMVLLPWFGVLLVLDLVSFVFPSFFQRIQDSFIWGIGFFALLLVVLAGLFPMIIIRLWGCKPLPEGSKRRTIEALFDEYKFRYSGIYLWTLFQGRISTAGILGIFAGSRYILITPSLLAALDDEEIEAVMAHEMGHAVHRHTLFYLLFILGVTIVFNFGLDLVQWLLEVGLALLQVWGVLDSSLTELPEAFPTLISLALTVPPLVLVLCYFYFGFGLISRNFERQSDLMALKVQKTADPIVRSFDKIAGFNPILKRMPSWHHHSIQKRIDFLRSCEAHPERIPMHHRRVRRLVIGYIVFIVGLTVLLAGWERQQWTTGWTTSLVKRAVVKQLEKDPSNAGLWLELGNITYGEKDLEAAQDAYRQAIDLDPDNAMALNNLAWLYATETDSEYFDPKEALKLAERAAVLKPDAAYILDTLAEAYFINGRLKDALEMEEQALAFAFSSERPQYLARIERYRKALEESL